MPTAGDVLPKFGNRFMQRIGRILFAFSGWRLEGAPPNIEKFVAIAAPHRSGWELALAFMVIFGMGIRVSWMAKHTIFWGPVGALFRRLGGIPIDRTARQNVVEQSIQQFATRSKLLLVLMPEGSRSRAGTPVGEWKSGYYHIAVGANVPLLPLYIDTPGKRLIVGQSIILTNDSAHDLAQIQDFYSDPTPSLNQNPASSPS